MSARMLVLAAFLMLAGCAGSRNDTAADACSKAMADKLAGKTFSLDRKDMVARAKDESADTVLIGSTITFDKGLSTEYSRPSIAACVWARPRTSSISSSTGTRKISRR